MMQDKKTLAALPGYQSIKIVKAAQIVRIEHGVTQHFKKLVLAIDLLEMNLFVNQNYIEKHKPQVGGYLVVYEDGYMSYSPQGPFEAGNIPLSDEQLDNEKVLMDKKLNAPRLTSAHVNQLMDGVVFDFHVVEGTTTTICTALLNGFHLAVGTSGCVDARNFDRAVGQKYAQIDAQQKAEDKLWELEGYHLHKANKFNPTYAGNV